MDTIGFYAGSFDPFTNGHLQIVKKATKCFSKVIVGIAYNSEKKVRVNKEKMKQAIEKTYKDASGKENRGLEITRKGCHAKKHSIPVKQIIYLSHQIRVFTLSGPCCSTAFSTLALLIEYSSVAYGNLLGICPLLSLPT